MAASNNWQTDLKILRKITNNLSKPGDFSTTALTTAYIKITSSYISLPIFYCQQSNQNLINNVFSTAYSEIIMCRSNYPSGHHQGHDFFFVCSGLLITFFWCSSLFYHQHFSSEPEAAQGGGWGQKNINPT